MTRCKLAKTAATQKQGDEQDNNWIDTKLNPTERATINMDD